MSTPEDIGQELEFPIDQELVDNSARAMEEWRVLRDRIKKIEEHKGQVNDKVYERVRSDYEERLAKATDALLEKKEHVDKELQSLAETKNNIENQLTDHRHKFEEINFRNTLGEFSDPEFQESAKTEQEKISKFETVLSAVDNNINRYESIFEEEDGLFARQEPHAPEEEISEIAEMASVNTDVKIQDQGANADMDHGTDEVEVPLEGSADYFAVEDGSEAFHGVEESNTTKASMSGEVERAITLHPRVVIINGENAGAAYPLKATTSFGRAESNTIALKDAKCSRQHSQIKEQGGGYIINDLNSSNGTFVNGEQIEEHVLNNGDEIQVGDTLMQFQIDE